MKTSCRLTENVNLIPPLLCYQLYSPAAINISTIFDNTLLTCHARPGPVWLDVWSKTLFHKGSINRLMEGCTVSYSVGFTITTPNLVWGAVNNYIWALGHSLLVQVLIKVILCILGQISQGCQNKPATGAFHRLFWILRRLLWMLVGQFWAWYWRNKMEIATYFLDGNSYSKTYWQPW